MRDATEGARETAPESPIWLLLRKHTLGVKGLPGLVTESQTTTIAGEALKGNGTAVWRKSVFGSGLGAAGKADDL